jgi:hypothetical protein
VLATKQLDPIFTLYLNISNSSSTGFAQKYNVFIRLFRYDS